ncbi:MAG: endo-1,4-beta-xylanase [Candidatus Solibacter sp.]
MFCGTHLQTHAALLVLALTGSLALAAPPTNIVQHGWEDGTLQGWIPRGPVALSNSTDVAHGGSHSLLTTGRVAGDNGPSLNVLGTLTLGATYQVSAWVRLTAGTPATQLLMRVERTVSGSPITDSIASSSATGVTDSGWTQLTGLYSFTGTNPTGLFLYIGSSSATASYYVDDFSIDFIADPAGPPPNTTGLSSTFESGGAEGWLPRLGSEVLTNSTAAFHSGTHSLLTTNRTTAGAGPALDVTDKMFNGSRYFVSLWARLAPGEPSTNLIVTLQRTAGTIVSTSTVVASKAVTSGSWVKLFTTPIYTLSLANTSLSLFVQSATGTPSFYIDDVQVTYAAPPSVETNLLSVKDVLAPYFYVGAISYGSGLTGPSSELASKHFNSITSENDMKWDATEPSEGTFRFTNMDAQVAWAKANGSVVRGHTLVWHSQIPAWVFIDPNTGVTMLPSPENKTLLLNRLRNHIQGVVTHFGTDIYTYDVVNEAIDEGQANCLRRSTWYTITGKDFIDVAFQTARQYAPHAKLIYNDYSSTSTSKRTCIYNLVADLKSRGIPIDGVGHQMHNSLTSPTPQAILDTFNLLAPLNIDQQVTELDIGVGGSYTNYNDIPESVLARQGYVVRNTFNAFRQLQGKLSTVTFWGRSDDHTWLTSATKIDAPLLFDVYMHAKPAYWGIVDPTRLPGASLTGSLDSKSGPQNARVWTIMLSNPGLGTAFGAQISKPVLTQTSGAACTPVVTGTFPITVGDIVSGSSASRAVTIDFTGCPALAAFKVTIPFSSSSGANTGEIARTNQFR